MTAGIARVRRWDWSALTPVLGLVLIALCAAAFAPSFFDPTNLSNLSRQASILAVIAAGQTLVLLVRGIDLSVGAVMTLAMVIVARMSGNMGDPLWPGLVAVLIFGLVVGSANAFLVVIRRVPPFVATLAIAVLIVGAQTAWTQGVPGGEVPKGLASLGTTRWLGIASVTVIGLGLIIALALLLRFTVLGRWIRSTGANPEAARTAGVPVLGVTAAMYVACALLAVLGGLLLGGYVGYVDGYLGAGYDLDSIAAAVIGGTSFAGGRGGVVRSLVGAFVIAGALNMIVLTGADQWLQLVVKGAVIIVAVAVQGIQWRTGKSRSRNSAGSSAQQPNQARVAAQS